MTDRDKLFWFIGLFEGEGSFSISNQYARCITITSTDKDVLERVQEAFGGTIIVPKLRNEKWKQEFVWYLNKIDSQALILKILPYLSKRRKERANDWLNLFNQNLSKIKSKEEKRKDLKSKILELKAQGKTQLEISREVGYERSYISKLLKVS